MKDALGRVMGNQLEGYYGIAVRQRVVLMESLEFHDWKDLVLWMGGVNK